MKSLRFIFLMLILAGGMLASGRAQLVHLSFAGDNVGWLNFTATSPRIPWDKTGGRFSRFDLYYDLGSAVDLGDGYFRFTDPTRSLWRVTMHHYVLGTFAVVRPLASVAVWENGLFFQHSVLDGPYENLEFTLNFEAGNRPPNTLPVPPFQVTRNHVFVESGQAFFDAPNLAGAYGAASFPHVTARIVDSVDLYPVPEPSTYALGAVALIGGVLLYGRRRGIVAGLR